MRIFIEPLHILKKDGYRMKIQFDFIADDLIFSLIRDMIRNLSLIHISEPTRR